MKTMSANLMGTSLFVSGMALLVAIGCGSEGPAGKDGVAPNVSVKDATAQQCPSGGNVVTVGDEEFIVCNGESGSEGDQGAKGQDGTSVVHRATELEPGADCEHGGFLVEYGPDENGNGELDDPEDPSGSFVVCNGATGSSPDITIEAATEEQCPISAGVVFTIDGEETIVCFENAATVTVSVASGCSVPADMAGTYVESLNCTSDEVGSYDAHCFRHTSSEWRIANTGCGWTIGRIEGPYGDWERYARSYTGLCSAMTPADHDPATALNTDTYYDGFGVVIPCVSSVYTP